jgi:hypothetical protein
MGFKVYYGYLFSFYRNWKSLFRSDPLKELISISLDSFPLQASKDNIKQKNKLTLLLVTIFHPASNIFFVSGIRITRNIVESSGILLCKVPKYSLSF